MTVLINSGCHLSWMSIMKEWDSGRQTIRPEAPIIIIKEPSAFTHCTIQLPAGQTSPIQPLGHTKEIHYSHRRWVAFHLRLNLHPEGSQIRTPGGGLPGGEDLPQISGSPADPGCFLYWPKGRARHAHRCRNPASECDKSVSCKHFLTTFLFIFNKKDLVCEINVFKGQKKVSERKTKGL